jgi:hypothetical protein
VSKDSARVINSSGFEAKTTAKFAVPNEKNQRQPNRD